MINELTPEEIIGLSRYATKGVAAPERMAYYYLQADISDLVDEEEIDESTASLKTQFVVCSLIIKKLINKFDLCSFISNNETKFGLSYSKSYLDKIEQYWMTDQCQKLINAITDDRLYFFKLPYVLDPLNGATRISTLRDQGSLIKLDAKRKSGNFYTPYDVALFMFEQLKLGAGVDNKILDPCCGTGIFLFAFIQNSLKNGTSPSDIAESLVGNFQAADLNPQATLTFTFLVTLAHCLLKEANNFEEVFKLLSNNVRTVDSLTTVDNKDKFDVVIGNPPYCSVTSYPTLSNYHIHSASFKEVNVYPYFMELGLKKVSEGGKVCFVVPLSISYSSTKLFSNTREYLLGLNGSSTFFFFDRAPHALFGDHVKTRNSIWLYNKESQKTFSLKTSYLRKTTSLNRHSFFNAGKTFLHPSRSSSMVIPKVGSPESFDIFQKLNSLINNETTSDNTRKGLTKTTAKILIGKTAYNYINAFLSTDADTQEGYLIINCPTLEEAFLKFSILRSNILYLYWHVIGDGFHVTSQIPSMAEAISNSIDKKTEKELVKLGRLLWEEIKGNATVSNNGGTFREAYPHTSSLEVIQNIDDLILRHLNLNNIPSSYPINYWRDCFLADKSVVLKNQSTLS